MQYPDFPPKKQPNESRFYNHFELVSPPASYVHAYKCCKFVPHSGLHNFQERADYWGTREHGVQVYIALINAVNHSGITSAKAENCMALQCFKHIGLLSHASARDSSYNISLNLSISHQSRLGVVQTTSGGCLDCGCLHLSYIRCPAC